MAILLFNSVFSEELFSYLSEREKSGYKNHSALLSNLRKFDRFCVEHNLTEKKFSRELADEIRRIPAGITARTHYGYLCIVKIFLEYLSLKGFDVCPPRLTAHKFIVFSPHIYTVDEINRYFNAVDTYDYNQNYRGALLFPLLMRIIYCCATRVGETLSIQKKDVDLDNGIIKLTHTKNGKERFIALPEDLNVMMRNYAEKVFWTLKDDDSYIFPSYLCNTLPLSKSTVETYHKEFLHKAKIPYLGQQKGPRLHDFKHTACVMSCKQLIDSGMDMYTAMPYLSAWAGHSSPQATEYYLHLTAMTYPYLQKKLKDTWENAFENLEALDEIY